SKRAASSLIHASLSADAVRGRTFSPESGVALNSGPRWLDRRPSPCAKRLCLPETCCRPRGAGGRHRSLRWRPKLSGWVTLRQPLTEGFLAVGETGADWASSVMLLHGAEAFAPCSVPLGVRTTSLLTGLSVACGATAWSRSAPVALLWASHPTPDRTGPRPVWGRPPCSGRLQGCMDAPRRASPSCPLCETDMQPGAILVLAPGEGADRRRGSGERSGAAVRRTPAPSVLECVCSAVGSAVTVAAGRSRVRRPCAGLLGGRGKGPPCRLSGDPTAGSLPQASTARRGRGSFSLRKRGMHAKGSSAPSFTHGGKALVLSRVVQARVGEGILRGAMWAGMAWPSHTDFFLTGAAEGRHLRRSHTL
ncbi:unnamed protein product, partial [Soboliphyme baturini]|uniref:Cyclic nucleotide-binding domain-containing protein n=1 Tax=Soboliphyme baturini TaxID=241478 RepID=A0A183JB18_9BILA